MTKVQPRAKKRLSRAPAAVTAARVLMVCTAFAVMITSGIVLGLRPGHAPQPIPLASFPVLEFSDPADGFIAAPVGELVLWPESGDTCRRITFDNRTGAIQEIRSILCGQTVRQIEPSQVLDRLAELRKTFRK